MTHSKYVTGLRGPFLSKCAFTPLPRALLGVCVTLKLSALRRNPVQASFYMLYILTNGLLARALLFLRLPAALIYLVLRAFSATARQRKQQWSRQYMWYGAELPEHTITLLLLFAFSIAQPLVSVVAVLYFALAYFVARYELLYAKREAFQAGGLFWPVVRSNSAKSAPCL